jgi:hypothetical protein
MTKKTLTIMSIAALLVASLNGQTSTTDPAAGAELTGTIKEYTAGTSLVLDTLPPTAPTQFKLAKNIVYADSDGKTIEAAGMTTNGRVRVHYHKIGPDNVADKISLIGN